MRIAIVGAGIVGCSCALFLQRDGHEVALVDQRQPGTGTSSGNAGIISLSSLLPIATPGLIGRLPALLRDPLSPLAVRWRDLPVLLPWLIRFALNTTEGRLAARVAALGSLLDRADQAHDIVIQQCGLADLVRSGGWLKIAWDAAILERETRRDREAWEARGRRWRRLGREELRALEPALAGDLAGALLLEENRAVQHPERYTAGIAATVLERGGRHLAAKAISLRREDGKVTALVTSQGVLPVEAVVIAAGAFSARLAAQGGSTVPLVAERGYHLMLPTPSPTLQRPVYSVEGGFVLAPMRHGVRLTGGVELAANATPPDYRRVRSLLPSARRLLPSLGEAIDSVWMGHRPSTPDSLPVIGRAPRLANLWFAYGHQHVGLTLGPMTGRLVADLVAGRDPGLDIAPFRPDRRSY